MLPNDFATPKSPSALLTLQDKDNSNQPERKAQSDLQFSGLRQDSEADISMVNKDLAEQAMKDFTQHFTKVESEIHHNKTKLNGYQSRMGNLVSSMASILKHLANEEKLKKVMQAELKRSEEKQREHGLEVYTLKQEIKTLREKLKIATEGNSKVKKVDVVNAEV